MKNGRIIGSTIKHFISEKAHTFQGRSKLREGDILFSIAGTIGNSCLVTQEDLPANTNQALAIIRGTSTVFDHEFLQYHLRSTVTRREVDLKARGGGMNNISLSDVKGIEVKIPPIREQRRIVAKLKHLLAKVDKGKERLERIPAILKRFRQSVLTAACSGELTSEWRRNHDSDHDWLDFRLGETGVVNGGITKNSKRSTLPLQVPYLRVANVYENELRLHDVGLIGVTKAEFERALLEEGDLLFVEGNGSVDQIGRVALWNGSIHPCLHQNHLIKFRASGEIVKPKFALFWMMSPFGRASLIESAVSTAGLNTLSISKIENLPIRLPSIEEQSETIRRVEALFKVADQIEARYNKAKAQVDRLTQSLLAKAFRGELVPQDPNDELASELLKRIREERAKRATKGKGR